MTHEDIRIYAVDRVEGELAVLVADDGEKQEVPVADLPVPVTEGTILRVELDGEGNPQWATAEEDEEEEGRRLARAREILNELRKRDPGGDIEL